MLNFPKTGSTFAREAIKKVYGTKSLRLNNALYATKLFSPKIIELFLPMLNEGSFSGMANQHGKYLQIPKKHFDKPVLSIVRNPFSRLVSAYYFGWWAKNLPTDIKTILRSFPNFPNLSFEEYFHFYLKFYRQQHLQGIKPKIEMGTNTLYFIRFFAKNPTKIISEIDEDYLQRKAYQNTFSHIHFIHQENLRSELKDFLHSQGFNERDLKKIDEMPDLNTSTYAHKKDRIMDLYSDDLIRKMLHYEKLLFSLFPDYVPLDYKDKNVRTA